MRCRVHGRAENGRERRRNASRRNSPALWRVALSVLRRQCMPAACPLLLTIRAHMKCTHCTRLTMTCHVVLLPLLQRWRLLWRRSVLLQW